METPRIIKKYSNRRLYDTTISKSITLEEIKDLVLKNIKFRVIDNTTDEDMTNYVLLQIITESESGHSPIFTTEILENFIRIYDNPMQKAISQFLEKSFSFVAEHQTDFQSYFQQNQPFDVIADLTKWNLALWQSLLTPGTATAQKNADNSTSKSKKKRS